MHALRQMQSALMLALYCNDQLADRACSGAIFMSHSIVIHQSAPPQSDPQTTGEAASLISPAVSHMILEFLFGGSAIYHAWCPSPTKAR